MMIRIDTAELLGELLGELMESLTPKIERMAADVGREAATETVDAMVPTAVEEEISQVDFHDYVQDLDLEVEADRVNGLEEFVDDRVEGEFERLEGQIVELQEQVKGLRNAVKLLLDVVGRANCEISNINLGL